MRHIRYRDEFGIVRLAIEQPRTEAEAGPLFMEANEPDFVDGATRGFTPARRTLVSDPELIDLPPGLTLLAPLDPPELWCAGPTFPAGMHARVQEAAIAEPYERLVGERRPSFFLRDAGGARAVAPGEPLAIRSDATWTAPEPEIGLVLGERGSILGYTIVCSLCSRDILGANPLFLSQATSYRASCSIGPSIYVERGRMRPFTLYMRITDETGRELFVDKTSTTEMLRSPRDLIEWLIRDNPLPPGTVLATGAALVPPADLSLQSGNVVEIHVPEIGTLMNPVVLAADLDRGRSWPASEPLRDASRK